MQKQAELGVYTFGNTPRTADGGGYGPTAQAIRNALEAVHVAEDVGLDFFGFGEHHTRSMPVTSPTSLVIAAAASTRRIKLGAPVSVLSTDEPIRVCLKWELRTEKLQGRDSWPCSSLLTSKSSLLTSGCWLFQQPAKALSINNLHGRPIEQRTSTA